MMRKIKLIRGDRFIIDGDKDSAIVACARVYCVDDERYICTMDAGDYSITRMEGSMDQASVTADDMVHMIYTLAAGRNIQKAA